MYRPVQTARPAVPPELVRDLDVPALAVVRQ